MSRTVCDLSRVIVPARHDNLLDPQVDAALWPTTAPGTAGAGY
jgi:hypothetical protein